MRFFLVIGSTSGIGSRVAAQLQARGEEVIAINRKADAAVSRHYIADVLQDELPPIDTSLSGLVYCPGSILLRPFKSLKIGDFQNDMNINFFGAIRVLQKYLPNLQQAAGASVVLFSTVAVQTGMPFHASVAAAKGAVEGLTRSLAAEWAPNIRVNCIAPSLTDTPMAARLLDTENKRIASADRHPLKKIGDSNDIASICVFLLGDQASFVTGQVWHVDGGMSALRV
jgi:3-oxoacyl-[acyl-carrier protein] reductase